MTALLGRVRAHAVSRYAHALGVAILVILGPRAGHAYCRTTTAPVPANYSAETCFTQGLPLFWKGACVGYNLNADASVMVPFPTATRVVDSAFATWNAAECSATGTNVGITTSNLGPVTCAEVRYNANGPNQNVIVFRDDKWPYSDPNNTLGLTTVTFNSDTGEIYDADMEINASDKNLTTTERTPANGYDLLSVVTHETGHFLGLAHATESKATMYASYRPGTSALRVLSEDDVAGLCAIYPSATERIVSTGVTAATACDPAPRHGFSSSCEENATAPDSGTSSSSSGGCAVTSADGAPNGAPIWALGVASVAALLVRVQRTRRHRIAR